MKKLEAESCNDPPEIIPGKQMFLNFKQKRKITYDFSKSLKNNCAGNLETYLQLL